MEFDNEFNEKLQESYKVTRALAHPLRLNILTFLDQHQVISEVDILSSMKLEQSIIIRHLEILKNSGIINMTKEGRQILFSINYSKLNKTLTATDRFLNSSLSSKVK